MSYYFLNKNRVVELRLRVTDESHWTNYFMEVSSGSAHPSALRRLSEAERGVIPEPYGQIFSSLNLHDKKIVDMGCGIGTYVLALHRKGYEVEGIEYSSALVEETTKKYPELKIYCEDATKTHYDNETVDIILSVGVVEHNEDGPSDFLQEIQRILKKGGLLIISVPFYDFFWKLRMVISDPYNPIKTNKNTCHFYQYRFNNDEFRTLLEVNGFDVLKSGSSGAIKSFEDSFPSIKKIFIQKGGYRFRQSIIKPLVEKLPGAGHMLWMVAKKI